MRTPTRSTCARVTQPHGMSIVGCLLHNDGDRELHEFGDSARLKPYPAKLCLSAHNQGRPVNFKHDARCVMGKVGEDKNRKRGIFIYCYKDIT